MKFLKNNLKIIIAFIVGVILAGGIVYAAVSAEQIDYTTDKNTEIKNVKEALNDLYNKNTKTPKQVSTLTTQGATYTFQNDGYILGTCQSSSDGTAHIYFNETEVAENAVFSAAYIYYPTTYRVSVYVPKGTTVYTREKWGTYNLTCYELK